MATIALERFLIAETVSDSQLFILVRVILVVAVVAFPTDWVEFKNYVFIR